MKKTFFLYAICMITLLFGLSSCKKIWDEIKHHPDGAADNCKIDTIYFTEKYGNPDPNQGGFIIFNDTADFKYNSSGQLISIDYASQKNDLGANVYPIMGQVFKYDFKGRLQGYFIEADIQGTRIGAQFAHWYTYINDKTVLDSLGTYTESSTIEGSNWLYGYAELYSKLTLDDNGRIIKEEYGDGNVVNYNYDSKSNLIKTGVTYTNKKSIYQTSKALMFASRDYSLNTPVGYATQFNSNQLPVKFNTGYLPLITKERLQVDTYENQNISVKYQCK